MVTKNNDPVVTQSILDTGLDDFGNKLRKEIVDDISEVIGQFAQQVDERFNKVEADIHILKTDVAVVKDDVALLNEKHDHLITTLDNFLKRLDDVETDNAARDAHISRPERRIERIETKTGIKL